MSMKICYKDKLTCPSSKMLKFMFQLGSLMRFNQNLNAQASKDGNDYGITGQTDMLQCTCFRGDTRFFTIHMQKTGSCSNFV